jgi:hypothetical protein
MKLPELEESVRSGRLVPDGKVCLNEQGELNVTKIAVEPVWYLPGVAERFGIDEGTLRRSLFEHTGGMYPEVCVPNRTQSMRRTSWTDKYSQLITRSDIKVFLPPIGKQTPPPVPYRRLCGLTCDRWLDRLLLRRSGEDV